MSDSGLNYYQFGQYYEQLKSASLEDGASVPPEALGFDDEIATECVLMLLENYPYWRSDMPNDVTNSKLYNSIVKYNKTKSIQKRVRNGNMAEINFLSGLEQVDNLESTGLEELKKHIIQPAQVLFIHGFMGDGKSFFSEVCAEIFMEHFTQYDENGDILSKPKLASNLTTINKADSITTYPDLKDWLNSESNASSSREKLFIFDEASSHATSLTGKQQAQTYNMLLPVIKQIRKAKGRIILIGHSGVDIAKDIRRLAMRIEKTGKKKAEVYDRGEDGSRLFSLYNIPVPSDEYKHDDEREEFAEWDWGDEDDGEWFEDLNQDEKDKILRDLSEDMTYKQIADSNVIPWVNSKGAVSKAVDRAIN